MAHHYEEYTGRRVSNYAPVGNVNHVKRIIFYWTKQQKLSLFRYLAKELGFEIDG